jgi:hypothetical protein
MRSIRDLLRNLRSRRQATAARIANIAPAPAAPPTEVVRPPPDDPPPAAPTGMDPYRRSMALFVQNISPAQLQRYGRELSFEVIGGTTGTRYRVRHGDTLNVDQLDHNGHPVLTLCFLPTGGLALGDVMLAQKIALELYELEALAIANRAFRGRD